MKACPDIVELPDVEPTRHGWPWTDDGGSSRPDPPDAGWPRITIVTPSFNQGPYLEETVRSVLLQDYPDLEYIVVDGGSTDSSVQIIRRYETWLAWWRSEPDQGQSDAINRGFARATGDIITFLASDDVYEPGTLHDVAHRWRAAPEHGAIIGAFRFMNESSRRQPEVHPPRLPGPGPHDLALLPTQTWRLHQVATFYSRQALDEVGRRVDDELHYTMDRDLLYRVCRRYPALLTQRPYATFRRHATNKSTTSIVPMFNEMASLHLRDIPADEPPDHQRQRRNLARERRARGYVKWARSGIGRLPAVLALTRALIQRPDLLITRYYLVSWSDALGFLDQIRRWRRRLLG